MKKAFLLLLLLLPFIGYCQQIHNVTVQHNQSSSNPGMEVIANMSLVHRPAILLSSTAHLRNDTLFLSACYYEGIQTMPVQFTDTFQVGNLATGLYTLHFTMIKSYNHLQCDSVASFIKVQSFTVNEITATKSELSLSTPEIFPNPVTDILTLESSPLKQISLYDLSGKQVHTEIYRAETFVRMDVSALPKGMYFLEMIGRDGVISRKRILKN